MSKGSSRISRNLIASGLVLMVVFWMMSSTRTVPVVGARGQECPTECLPGQTHLTLISGDGTVCNDDPKVQFFDGVNWVPAKIVDPNDDPEVGDAYSTIPLTKWVSLNCAKAGAENTFFFYRITFTLPAFANASLTVKVHSDNAAELSLNGGAPFGAQTDAETAANFQGDPETFCTTSGFAPGPNVLSFKVHNFQIITGIDFVADICYTPVQGCVDEDAPMISCSVAQTSLWPPNHQLENVGLTASVTDDCDHHVVIGGGPNGTGVTVYSDEQDLDQGSGNFSPDAKNIGLGTLRLRSERGGPFNGRVYLIVVQATDAAGHTGYCAKTVTVPHDQSKASKQSVEAQATNAKNYFLTHHTPPPGFVQVGVGPIVGPKQ